MTTKMTMYCDCCKSEGQDEAYRQNASNFTRKRIETINNAGGPINNTMEEYTICNVCKEKADGFNAKLEALLTPLKENQKILKG